MSKFKSNIINSPIKSEKSLLTISELSILLNLKESHIRKLIFCNEIPYFKIGRLIRFSQPEIDTWLNNCFNHSNDKAVK